jgi:hypothetical protein
LQQVDAAHAMLLRAREAMARRLVLTFVLVLAAAPAGAVVDSDLGAARAGGGCYPTGITAGLLDMLTLINPEWAPIVDGTTVDSAPVLVHGTVQGMHGDTSGDFPSTHLRADVNHFVLLDPQEADRLATGNDDGLIHTEWEAGTYPAWAWAGTGDRVVALGRWIFDCGHTGAIPGACSVSTAKACVLDKDCRPPLCATCGSMETCVGSHFGYSAEIHPPYATAAIRRGRGAVVSDDPGAPPIPATRVDVYVSDQAGGAGDRCVLTHQAQDVDLLGVECFPLSQPVAQLNAQDFVFDVPLPPRPPGARRVLVRKVSYAPPGGIAARVRIRRRLADPDPHVQVTVRLRHRTGGTLPTGFAGTIFAGWKNDATPLTHVRVTLDELVVDNGLHPASPVAPKTCSTTTSMPCASAADCPSGESCVGVGPVLSWQMQAAINGEWQEFAGLGSVDTGDVIPLGLVYEQYLPATGSVHLEVNGRSHECIDTIYGKSLATDLAEIGFNKGVGCLASEARSPGDLDVTYGAPGFGAGPGTMSYDVTSVGGAGGRCSMTTGALCTVDGDCPSGESCVATGGAFSLRYRIERLR